ncbi:hypothetical protein [Nocardioides marmoribigeumensis]|uniref:Uncharacterized protein n=1 Tax=Nocardioides marmoribigeumensis TaxID=433649 RepID=A0ABU2BRV8_9ACTN|nr:hypothetical protein [Nocardioides marmoribigeumensis]MDR7361382.1 hypothetical protein [Nocardioides marmoribigeumensis]
MGGQRQPLFDDFERTDATPSTHQESTFEFLNRIAGDYWEHPRALMQEWLDHIPSEQEHNDLRQRFRSRDDEQFRSAFLELYLHESLVRAGYSVTIHPKVRGTRRRPDFLAERDNLRIFIEAVAPGSTPAEKAAAQRRAVLFDTVNQLGDPNFMLWLDELEEGASPPASARLRKDLRRWLAELDPDAPWDADAAPTRRWEHDDWAVRFRAVPKKPDARGTGPNDRAIAVYGHTGVDFIDDAPAIKKALATKHHEYGDLGTPFIIAVGTYIHDRDRWHSSNAMYGHVAVQIDEAPDGSMVTREVRRPDGYFGTPPTWTNRNVSGVLLVNQLMPYYVQRAETTLWRHPNPIHELPEAVGFPGDTLSIADGTLVEVTAATKADQLFGLPDPWPPGEAWPGDQ